MHVMSRRARRRFLRRCAYEMSKPKLRAVLWTTAGISAAGSLLYFTFRKRHALAK